MDFNKIKSFEDACEATGYDPISVLPDVSKMPEPLRAFAIATVKRAVIAEAINAGWTPDWTNSDQWKYYPWFRMNDTSGFGLSYIGYDFTYSYTFVGSRLVFFSRQAAQHFGENFMDLHRDAYVIAKN